MSKIVAVVTVVAFTLTAVACSDTPAPSAKGTRVLETETQETAEAKPPPETQRGVVPDLIEVSVGDAKKAVQDAGFEVGKVDVVGLFGTPSNEMLVCSQKPAAGAEPGKKAKVDLVADRQC